VRLLARTWCDPSSLDPDGLTPLHLAAGWGFSRVCGILLLAGADKRALDGWGRTPVDLARLNDRHGNLAPLSRWGDVGLPNATISALSEPPPLPPLLADAKAAGDTELYLQLRSLDLKEKATGQQSRRLVPTLEKIAALLRARGQSDSALGCLRRVVYILEGAVGGDDSSADDNSERTASQVEQASVVGNVVRALNNLGELCFSLGRSGEAEACLKRALASLANTQVPRTPAALPAAGQAAGETFTTSGPATTPFRVEVGKVAVGKAAGDCASDEHRFAAALESALENPLAGTVARNLGLVYFLSGEHSKALPFLSAHLSVESARLVNRDVGMTSESLELIPAIELLGKAHALLGHRDKALALFGRAKAIASRECGAASVQFAAQLEQEGLAHFLSGDFRAAERSFRETHDALLDSGEHTKFDPHIMRVCSNMAIAQCRRGPSRF